MTAITDIEDDSPIVSKSERKRQMIALQKLGLELAKYQPSVWQQLQLTAELQKELKEHQSLTSNEAKRRHAQYIGKLMRKNDSEQITDWLEQQAHQQRSKSIRASQLPQTFNALITDTDAALQQLFTEFPQADRQKLVGLLRQIHASAADNQYPPIGKHQQKLWKLLVELENQR